MQENTFFLSDLFIVLPLPPGGNADRIAYATNIHLWPCFCVYTQSYPILLTLVRHILGLIVIVPLHAPPPVSLPDQPLSDDPSTTNLWYRPLRHKRRGM